MEGFEKESKVSGSLEALRERVFELKSESKDPYFTEYLANLQERVIKEKHTVDLLYDELERKYALYLERMENAKQEQDVTQELAYSVETGETPVAPRVEQPATLRKAVKQKKNGEFTIGIVVFSIVGVVFLLTAFAMLGAHFMDSFAKGISLYGIALVVCLFSELLVHKRSQKLSQVLTILGIAGIHVSTYVNTYVMYNMNWIVAAVLVILTTLGAIGADKYRRGNEWKLDGISVGAYYLFAIASYWMFATQELNIWKSIITLIILAVLTRALAWRNKKLYLLDSILTTIVAILALAEYGEATGYVLMGVLLLSALTLRFWHLYYQCLITITTVLYAINVVESEIVLALVVAVLWLFMLLFNHVKVLCGASVSIYNYIVVALELICCLCIAFVDYEEFMILYFILAFLGVGFIYFMCQERYYLSEKARGLALSIFGSYMVLVVDFSYSITSSILLMLIGLCSIGTGFAIQDKKIRIYGLVLSLIVCFKITLFDFSGADELQKMLLFFVAGLVALLISGIYIVLEKKYIKD